MVRTVSTPPRIGEGLRWRSYRRRDRECEDSVGGSRFLSRARAVRRLPGWPRLPLDEDLFGVILGEIARRSAAASGLPSPRRMSGGGAQSRATRRWILNFGVDSSEFRPPLLRRECGRRLRRSSGRGLYDPQCRGMELGRPALEIFSLMRRAGSVSMRSTKVQGMVRRIFWTRSCQSVRVRGRAGGGEPRHGHRYR